MKHPESFYHYTQCGLSNVWLRNGFTWEDIDGEMTLAIDDLDGLHRAIGLEICRSPFINGEEFRFLRKELGYSQSRLAEILGVSENSIANWERNSAIPKAVIALHKAMYLEQLNQQFTLTFLTQRCQQVESVEPMSFMEQNGKWLMQAA